MPRERTLRSLTRELLDTPFFPLLFISEAVKQLAQSGAYVKTHAVLAAVATVIWIFSDAISVDWDDNIIGDSPSENEQS